LLRGLAATYTKLERNGEKVGHKDKLRARRRRYLHLDYTPTTLAIACKVQWVASCGGGFGAALAALLVPDAPGLSAGNVAGFKRPPTC